MAREAKDLPTVIDWLNSAGQTKEDLRAFDPTMKNYVQYVINLGFAQHRDTILYANDMNLCAEITNGAHYSFFLNSVRPCRRMGKWAKQVREEHVN